jgi:hypothetical protein
MKSSSWTLAPARLAPASLDPRPVKNENSPGFPTSTDVARAYAREIKADRARRVPWRTIAARMSISRIEAIRLAHSLDEVLDEIRAEQGTAPAERQPYKSRA